jgi:hypothetical protein
MPKKLIKNFAFTYLQSKCICKVLPKTNIFYGLCKKEKNYHVKCLIFSTKICPFYTRHTTRRFIVKRLYRYVACEDGRADFLFQIF